MKDRKELIKSMEKNIRKQVALLNKLVGKKVYNFINEERALKDFKCTLGKGSQMIKVS